MLLCTGLSNRVFNFALLMKGNKTISTYPSFGFSKSRENVGIVLYDGPPHGGARNATSP